MHNNLPAERTSPAVPSLMVYMKHLVMLLLGMTTIITLLFLIDQIVDYSEHVLLKPLDPSFSTVYFCAYTPLLLIISLAFFLVSLYVMATVRKKVLEPFKRLSASIRAIKDNDFHYQIEGEQSFSELEELSSALNAMSANLEEKKRMRQKLLSGLAHELFTPLTILRGTLEGIQEGVFEADEKIALLIDEVLHLQHLIRDFRDLSMAEAGVLPLKIRESDVGELLRQAVQLQEPLFQEKKLTLHMTCQSPSVCSVDPERFTQIVGNLLNAIVNYTAPGGEITIHLAPLTGERKLCLSITDNGPAIAQEQIPYVFEHFYGPESTRSTGTGKSHIPLALVKGLVQAHGGDAALTMVPEKGNTFSLTFPL